MANLMSGMFGGMTSTMGKMFILILSFKPGYSYLFSPLAWTTGMSVVGLVVSNYYNLNLIVALYSQLIVLPTYECCIILGTLVSGGIVMQEFLFYTQTQLTIIFMGSCIAISGIMYKVCMLEVEDLIITDDGLGTLGRTRSGSLSEFRQRILSQDSGKMLINDSDQQG